MFKKSSRVLLVTLLLFVLAGATYAFAAGNTVPDTLAGDGDGVITGYVVSNIHYGTSNGYIAGVTFELDGTAATVQAAIGDNSVPSSYIFSNGNCTFSSPTWSCTFPADTVTVIDAYHLRVVAVE